jgi:hypothetical protein
MSFKLLFTEQADYDLEKIEKNPSYAKLLKSVRKALGYLETNPKHQSLQTHKYNSFKGSNGEEVFEAYAENHTPGAYRIFWFYGPDKKEITIVAITAHP